MTLPLLATFALALTIAVPPPAIAAPVALSPTARLRPQGERAATLLRLAQERSPSVRRLVEELEAGDVIVYLDLRHDLDPNVAACLTWMAATSTRRIVRASMRIGLRQTDAIAMIAHELHHAVEVLRHPEVRSSEALLDLYTRIGQATANTGRHFDTPDAVAAGTLAWLEATRRIPSLPARPAAVRPGM